MIPDKSRQMPGDGDVMDPPLPRARLVPGRRAGAGRLSLAMETAFHDAARAPDAPAHCPGRALP